MKLKLTLPWIAGLGLFMAVVISGCATPESRIKKNPEIFATFSPEIQEAVRNGQIDIGYTSDMVTMALGAPNRLYTRTTGAGIVEVWSYTSTRNELDRQRVKAEFRYRDPRGGYSTASDWVWVDVSRKIEFEKMRVEFTEGKVSAIETLK